MLCADLLYVLPDAEGNVAGPDKSDSSVQKEGEELTQTQGSIKGFDGVIFVAVFPLVGRASRCSVQCAKQLNESCWKSPFLAKTTLP